MWVYEPEFKIFFNRFFFQNLTSNSFANCDARHFSSALKDDVTSVILTSHFIWPIPVSVLLNKINFFSNCLFSKIFRNGPMGINIFVYGTLKRGEPNHWLIKRLRRHVRFLSVGTTKGAPIFQKKFFHQQKLR